GRAEHRMVLDQEVLPPEEHAAWRRAGDRMPRLQLVRRRALTVHVDDNRKVVVPGFEALLAGDHRELELMQYQQLLRQVQPCGQARQPADHAVDLAGADASDLLQWPLAGM